MIGNACLRGSRVDRKVHLDHDPEAAGEARLHTDKRILDHDRRSGERVKPPRRLDEDVRGRLARYLTSPRSWPSTRSGRDGSILAASRTASHCGRP